MKATLRSLLNRYPRLKSTVKRVRDVVWPAAASVSSNYVEVAAIDSYDEAARLRSAWQAEGLPHKQRELVDSQLAIYRKGEPVDVFDVMVQSMRKLHFMHSPASVLDVGCASGFYSEVFDLAQLRLKYTGCDYSEAFVRLAREKYPSLSFDVEDATSMSYASSAFDVVISGCCLLHIPEYETAIAETSRVARYYAIFHRTAVVLDRPNKYYRKLAYGVETVEIHFNEEHFLTLLAKHGMEILETYTLSESIDEGVISAVRTYVCGKIAA
jgi:ubiquinone/menaquinone biosynthesis C-methylase UbiE